MQLSRREDGERAAVPSRGALLVLARIHDRRRSERARLAQWLRRHRVDCRVLALAGVSGSARSTLGSAQFSLSHGQAVALAIDSRAERGRALHELARVACRHRASTLVAHAGRCIRPSALLPANELARLPTPMRPDMLRLMMDATPMQPAVARHTEEVPVVCAGTAARVAHEIGGLAPPHTLLRRGSFQVCLAPAQDIPETLQEIGRLRELSFRAAGEGSGRARDLDEFDAHYEHLFVWHAQRREIVGAYRLMEVSAAVSTHGLDGLYTHSLFDYDERLFSHFGACLELGRSFVAPGWQRSFQPLRLLWSGIATLLASRPALRCLFGPVSISANYGDAACRLMAHSLMHRYGLPASCGLVRPRHPPAERARRLSAASGAIDMHTLSTAVRRLSNGAGLPVLVRQYLELNGRFACFSFDAAFGNVLDGLVFVEVASIPEVLMRRLLSLSD